MPGLTLPFTPSGGVGGEKHKDIQGINVAPTGNVFKRIQPCAHGVHAANK